MKNMTIRMKLIIAGVVATIIPLVLIAGIAMWKAEQAEEIAAHAVEQLARNQNEGVVSGVVAMVTSMQEVLEQKTISDLNVARDILRRTGRVHFAETTVQWRAINQFSREETNIRLPRMMVGDTWLGQNANVDRYSPIVDDTRELVGGTATIFQRMNEAGDMLRVSTNVQTLDGNRAIGTYIPARNPDGTPNRVLERVLSGQRFIGRAFVVNAWYVTAYEPIMDDGGRVVGVLYVGVPEESAESLRRQIMEITVGETGYVFVVDSKGQYIISHHGAQDGENIWEARDAGGRLFVQEMIARAKALRTGEFAEDRYPWKNPGEAEARMKTVSIAYFAPWDWIIGAGTFDEEIFQDVELIRTTNSQGRMVIWSVLAATLIAVVALWLLLASRITGPINRLMKYAEAVAGGDLHAQSNIDQQDEVGKLNRSIQSMVGTLIEKMEEADVKAKEAEQKAEECNLATQEAEEAKRQAEQAQRDGMLQAAGRIEGVVEQVGSASEQLAAQVEQASRGAEEQRSRTGETATAMEEMNATVLEVAKNASQAAEASDMARTKAVNGADVVSASVAAINKVQRQAGEMKNNLSQLGQQAEQIGRIMNVIEDIADQTNLLALNAAIEAARAGDAGRGFAVVADEVRKLAEKTMNATKEVGDAISAIQQGTRNNIQGMDQSVAAIEEATQLANKSGEALKEILALAEQAADQVRSIATAAEQQSATSEEINRGVEDINRIASQTSEVMNQSAEAVSELARQGNELRELVRQLKEA
ncbi:methyl-accepting chemotaxis sensory transducer [Desulfonatronum zhilinae]|nr:methyl-accepting chemotaxis sensory transducer [Desulfonatronum zhilinae]